MAKYKLGRLGDRYYLEVKRTGKLLYVIGYVDSPDGYDKALAKVAEMNSK